MAKNLLDLATRIHPSTKYIHGTTSEGIPYKAPKGDVTYEEIFYHMDGMLEDIFQPGRLDEIKRKIKKLRGSPYYSYDVNKPSLKSMKNLNRKEFVNWVDGLK